MNNKTVAILYTIAAIIFGSTTAIHFIRQGFTDWTDSLLDIALTFLFACLAFSYFKESKKKLHKK